MQNNQNRVLVLLQLQFNNLIANCELVRLYGKTTPTVET